MLEYGFLHGCHKKNYQTNILTISDDKIKYDLNKIINQFYK